ncbi:MAG: FIST C-terminal domain-containing protein [Chitinophagales bacterium]|nr:FIST C-terminal domain-containing protein [Chitinophagales bacterium]
MKLRKQLFTDHWETLTEQAGFDSQKAQLVLAFGDTAKIVLPEQLAYLRESYPNAAIAFASTSGEIASNNVYDHSIVALAIWLEKSNVVTVETDVREHESSFEAGIFLRNAFPEKNLKNIFVLSDGTLVNGSELVQGLNHPGANEVLITGGLAGDADRFEQTFTGLNAIPQAGKIVAIGFYGDALEVSSGSLGGWDEFGPERIITGSDKNVLHSIDHKNALELYKEYLGPFKNELPGSALLFPLSISGENQEQKLVRTILSIDEVLGTMTFAGNMPVGSKVRLMKANFDKIIDASASVAKRILDKKSSPELAILISCVGRKLILRDRAYEEIVAAKHILGENVLITGFYSYGEISPATDITLACELHNQTMTITTFREV